MDHDLLEQLDGLHTVDDVAVDGALRARLESDMAARQLFEQIRAIDGPLGAAVRDVEAPAGLQQRILDSLGEADAIAKPSPTDEVDFQPNRSWLVSRRTWLAVGTTALAASLALLWIQPWKSAELEGSLEQVLTAAMEFYGQNDLQSGQLSEDSRMLASHPISVYVNGRAQTGWRQIDDFLGHSAVAYDLKIPDVGNATLYVLRRSASTWPASPHSQPLATGGLWATGWQEGDLAYVMVIRGQGNIRSPERYFLSPESPIL